MLEIQICERERTHEHAEGRCSSVLQEQRQLRAGATAANAIQIQTGYRGAAGWPVGNGEFG